MKNQQKLYLAQQEKTLIFGLLVAFNFSFLTCDQFCFISQLSAERQAITLVKVVFAKGYFDGPGEPLKIVLLSELEKEKGFNKLRKQLHY